MMHAVRGVYRGGVVELLEAPDVVGEADVVVTFLTGGHSSGMVENVTGTPKVTENAEPLDDFEPIVPTMPVRLSDLVLEDRG